jgi:hypothetical protein
MSRLAKVVPAIVSIGFFSLKGHPV